VPHHNRRFLKPGEAAGFLSRTGFLAALFTCCALLSAIVFPSAAEAASPSAPSSFGASSGVVGIRLNGSYMGDDRYDVSKVTGGELSTTRNGRTLTGRVHVQKRELDTIGSDLSFVSLSADGSVEVRLLNCRLLPYVSTGVCYGRIDLESSVRAEEDTSATLLQFGAGVGIPMSNGVTVEARYRYYSPVDREVMLDGTPVDMDISKHNLLVGLRFSF
jgi:opacity protein-like surface antigen